MPLIIGTTEDGKPYVLDDSYVTETAAILAKKRTGKSNTACVIVEEMHDAGHHFVVVDAKGDWAGIRSNAEGTGPGLPIPIFGGLRGDVALHPDSGAAVARLIFERELSCVLDVSRFDSKAAQARFLTAFAEEIYRLHQEEPRPVHLILEEADQYLPQMVTREDGMTRCVGAWSKLVRLGGAFGLGVTLITQRPAGLNKNVLTQIEVIFVHRTPAAADKKAVSGWLGEKDEQADIIPTLSSLANGEAWVSGPAFVGETARVQMRRRRTFDSGATPKVGERRVRRPTTLADIDVGEITALFAAEIEQAEADDPKALHRQIAKLEKQLAEQARTPQEVEVPVVDDEYVDHAQELAAAATELIDSLASLNGIQDRVLEAAGSVRRASPLSSHGRSDIPDERFPADVTPSRPVPPAPRRPRGASTAALGAGAPAKLLNVLAQHPDGCTRSKLALLAGYAPTKSTIRNAMTKLRSEGYIETDGDLLRATPAGRAAAGDPDPFPTGEALVDFWSEHLGGAPLECFTVLIDCYPEPADPTIISRRTRYETGSSTIRNAMTKLRGLGLANGWTASHDLFT